MSEPEEIRRPISRVPTAATILLIVGVVLLLNTTGAVGWGVWWSLLRFWPLILIAVGLNIILAPRFPLLATLAVALTLAAGIGLAYLFDNTSEIYSYQPGSEFLHSSPLDEIEALEMNIDFAAVSLAIGSDMSGFQNELFVVRSTGIDANVREARNGSVSEATLSANAADALQNSDEDGWNINIDPLDIMFGLGGANWKVEISPDVVFRLDIDGGASELDLDLRDVNLQTLNLDIGAADLELVVPANAGRTRVYISAGASNIDIQIPQGVASYIYTDAVVSSINVDTDRFPARDGAYVSPDYDASENKLFIDIDAGVSRISIK